MITKNQSLTRTPRTLTLLFFLLFLISIPSKGFGQQIAFPSASGAGAYATGGRGKPVYIVTNLNNAGPGSFRQALLDTKLSNGGIITFEVSGTINLTSDIEFANQGNITIAGQSAPEGGITIANKRLTFQNVNNLIIRYLRFRPKFNPFPSTENDVLEIYECSNYIVDHCSFSWGTDEVVNSGNGRNYTWQRNLIAESNKTGMIMGGEPESSENMSFVNNMFYNCSHRFPNWSSNGRVDVINNVIWNWKTRMSVPSGGFQVNHINNFYMHYTNTPPADTNTRGMLWYPNTTHFPSIFTSGNYINDVLTNPNEDNWFMWRFRFNPSGTPYSGVGDEAPLTEDFRVYEPFSQLGINIDIKSAVDAFEDIKYNVGANSRLLSNGSFTEDIDMIDTIYLNNVQNNVLVDYTPEDIFNTAHRNAFLSSVSSTPINVHPSTYDTDSDGMSDLWEMNTFSTLSRNGMQDFDGDGYTDVEEFLNGVDYAYVPINSEIIISSNDSDNTICKGESLMLSASEASSYLWSTGETSASITVFPSTTTTYSVVAQFADGSSDQANIVVVVNESPAVYAGEDQTIYAGQSVSLSASGANTYSWSTGQTTSNITVSPSVTTTYSVTGYSNGCEDSVSVTVFVLNTNENVNADIAGGNFSICRGVTTTLYATGGASYLWSNGATTSNITVSPTETTTYTVTAFSASGNSQDQDSVTITVNAPEVNAGIDQSINANESITLTATGANSYLWNTGETTSSITVSPNETTTYTVTGTSSGCSATDTVTVFVAEEAINASIVTNNDSICYGESTILTAYGGESFLWSTGATTQSITVAPNNTSTYTVTVFNSSGTSEDQDSIVIHVNPAINANAGADVEICQGNSTTLSASGGTSYLWSTGQTTQNISVSPNQTTNYTVEVFKNGCSDSDSVTVSVNPVPNVNAGNDITISQGQSATLTASGANSYSWSNGQTTSSITVSPIVTTTYSVTGTSNGCEATDEVTVHVQNDTDNEVNADIAGGNFSICAGTTTVLLATGGSSYLWSTGQTSSVIVISPTVTTTYTVTAYNETGSSQDVDSVTVSVYGNVDAGDDVSTCIGGSLTLTATPGESYLWSTGETTQSIIVTPDETTTYSVEVVEKFCTGQDDVTVFVNDTLNVNASEDITISEGQSTILTATGADSYLWSTGETTSSISVSPNNTSTYTVTGFTNECEATDEVTVFVESNSTDETVNADISGGNFSICAGSTTVLVANGGASYLWSTGETTQAISISPTETTTYTVTAYSASGSSQDQDSITVSVYGNANAGEDVSICLGSSTVLTASQGESYLWSTGETTQSITVNPTETTLYSVEIFEKFCTGSDEVLVTVNDILTVDAGNDIIIDQGESTTLTASGADSYLWSTGETTASIEVAPLTSTTYWVTGYTNGCEGTDEVLVSVVDDEEIETVNADIGGGDFSICPGATTVLVAYGGASYLWSTGETSAVITISPEVTTTYTVTAFSPSGNSQDQDSVTVTVNSIAVDAGADAIIQQGDSITLTATGADSYLWSTGETTQSITVSPASTETYSVAGYRKGCMQSDEVTVEVENHNIRNVDDTIEFVVTQNLSRNALDLKIMNLNENTTKDVVIMSLNGQVMYDSQMASSEKETSINIARFERGIYAIRLTVKDQTMIKKVVIR